MAVRCNECDAAMDRVSEITQGPAGISCDSADYECPDCGNVQENEAVW